MRIITKEQDAAMRRNRVYCRIVSTPPPDFTAMKKEAEEFERWISREHRKERARLAARRPAAK